MFNNSNNGNGMMSGLFGKAPSGMCRLAMNGKVAIRTSSGYKTYDVDTERLVNCSNFVIPNVSEDFFFVIPTNRVKKGDVVIISGKPRCVIEATKNQIKVMNYENSTIEIVVPERHIFLGNAFLYGKIMSPFGTDFKGKGMNKIMKYMMMSQMMGGGNVNTTNGNNGGGMGNMLPFMMMSGGFDDMFDGMFDFDFEDDDEEEQEDDPKEEDK